MLERVQFFAVHVTAHVWLYSIPRLLHMIFVRVPVTLWELITFKRPFTYCCKRARHITVVATSKDLSAKERLMRFFGLTDDMQYRDPLYNGHVHTVLGNARLPKRVPYERELLAAKDGNPICLDWLRVPEEHTEDAKGIVLVVPGVGNYGQTPYVQRFVRGAVARGYHCCVLTPRGMGSAPLTTPNITCITFTCDLNHTLRHKLNKEMIAKEFGKELPLFVIGYSCGASTMLKSLAEECQAFEKDKSIYKRGFPVAAAISMLAPCDMVASSEALRTPWGRLLYAKPITVALKKYLCKHRTILMSLSEGKSEEEKAKLAIIHVDFDEALRLIKTPRDVDRYAIAPHFNYEDEFDYYRHCFAFDSIRHIRGVPVMCVNNCDDPISGYVVTPEQWQKMCDERPNVAYVEMPCGGHFGYLQNPWKEYTHPFSFLQNFPLDAFDVALANSKDSNKNA